MGRRRGSDLALLWLWCRLAAAALIGPLAWEPPYAAGVALKSPPPKKKNVFAHHTPSLRCHVARTLESDPRNLIWLVPQNRELLSQGSRKRQVFISLRSSDQTGGCWARCLHKEQLVPLCRISIIIFKTLGCPALETSLLVLHSVTDH